ncbi:MAG: hypothetical protein ACE5KE_11135, partial [Methanosarcinales archaeon]
VQLQDSNGNPVPSPYNLKVEVVPDNPSLLSFMSNDIIIPEGSSQSKVEFRALESGLVQISAYPEIEENDKDLEIGTNNLEIKDIAINNTLYKVVPYIAPSKLLADGRSRAEVIVQLQDLNGSPVPAPDNIPVALSLSDTFSGALDNYTLEIDKGKSSAETYFTSDYKAGNWSIIASALGISKSANFSTSCHIPNKIKVRAVPESIGVNGKSIGAKATMQIVYVQLLDENGNPARAYEDLPVALIVEGVGKLENSTLTIPKGSTYASTWFYGEESGSAKIKVYSEFGEYETILDIYNPSTAQQVIIYASPDKILQNSSANLVVQLQDLNGSAAIFDHDINIELKLNEDYIELEESELIIKKGNDTAFTSFKTSFKVGKPQIHPVPSEALFNPNVSVEIVGSVPTSYNTSIIPEIIIASPSEKAKVLVNLQLDQLPAYAPHDIEVKIDDKVGILEKGKASLTFTINSSYNATERDISPEIFGFYPEKKILKKIGRKLNQINLSITPTIIRENESAIVSVQLQDSEGNPVPAPENIKVNLTLKGSGKLEKNVLEIEEGDSYASTLYTSTVVGTSNIMANRLGKKDYKSVLVI